jgi:hypothetical protein
MKLRILISIISILGYHVSTFSQSWTEKLRVLPQMDLSKAERFGYAVDYDDGIVVIGSPLGHVAESKTGYVSVIEKQGNVWIKIAQLSPSNPDRIESFGRQVSIDNNVIVVSAAKDQSAIDPVFVFEMPAGGWKDMHETAILTSSLSDDYSNFGHDVAISNDIIIVSDTYGDALIDNAGVVHVFERPSGGWLSTNQSVILYASNPTDQNRESGFGYSIDINGDDIVIGSPYHDSNYLDQGAIYYFKKPGSGWTGGAETAILLSDMPGNNHHLGLSVSLNSDYIAGSTTGITASGESAGAIYIFEKETDTYSSKTQDALLTPDYKHLSKAYYGNTNVIATDNYAFLSTFGYNENDEWLGIVYSFEREATGWKDEMNSGSITASDQKTREYFGSAIAGNDDVFFAGSYDDNRDNSSGSVYIYENTGHNWIDSVEFDAKVSFPGLTAAEDNLGQAVAVSGNYAIIGSPYDDEKAKNAGAVYFFWNNNGTWQLVRKIMPDDGNKDDWFGQSVSLYGKHFVIGSPNSDNLVSDDGAVYVYRIDQSNHGTELIEKIVPLDIPEDTHIGTSCDIHKNSVIISGFDGYTSQSHGKVFIYEINQSGISMQAQLRPEQENQYSYWFGVSVAIFEDQAMVGVGNGESNYYFNQSIAYIYQRPKSGWQDMTETVILNRTPGANTGSFMARNMAIDLSDSIAVYGYPRSSENGKALLYQRPQAGWTTANETSSYTMNENSIGEGFGEAISMSGNYLLISNPGVLDILRVPEDNLIVDEFGSVYLFEKDERGWFIDKNEDDVLGSSFQSKNARFGQATAIYGTSIVVGAPKESNAAGFEAGAGYFFQNNQPYVKNVEIEAKPLSKIGDTLKMFIQYDRPISVIDDPFIILNIESPNKNHAQFSQIQNDNTLVFLYKVQEGDQNTTFNYLNENSMLYSGTITEKDNQDLAANRVLPPIGTNESITTIAYIDGIKPKADITILANNNPDTQGLLLISVSFSEELKSLNEEMFGTQNGDLIDFEVIADIAFMKVKPLVEDTVVLYLKSNHIEDLAGNFCDSVGIQSVFSGPLSHVILDGPKYTNKPYSVKYSFIEPISDFYNDNISALNATLNGFDPSEPEGEISVAPAFEGETIIYIGSNSYFDRWGFTNDSTAIVTIYDITPPMVEIVAMDGNYVNKPFQMSIDPNEPYQIFNRDFLDIENGVLDTLYYDSIEGKFILNISPVEYGEVTLKVNEGVFIDSADNASLPAIATCFFDNIPPEATINSNYEFFVNNPFYVTLDFGSVVISKEDIMPFVLNGTVTVTNRQSQFIEALITPKEQGMVEVGVLDSAATDLAGNYLIGASRIYHYDSIPPDLVIETIPEKYAIDSFKLSIWPTEKCRTFQYWNIEVNNAKMKNYQINQDTITAILFPIVEGEVEIIIPANTCADFAGNQNAEKKKILYFDSTKPTISFDYDFAPKGLDIFDVLVNFSEEVQDMTTDRIQAENLTITGFSRITESQFSITFEPDYEKDIFSFQVLDSAVVDLAGNPNVSSSREELIVTSISEGLNTEFIIFPNPTTGEFKIKLPESISEDFYLEIYNLSGIRVFSEFRSIISKETTFNKELKEGVYIVQVVGESVFKTQKLIVK